MKYYHGTFPNPEMYLPTLYDSHSKDEIFKTKNGSMIPLQIGVWDTSGSDEYDRLR